MSRLSHRPSGPPNLSPAEDFWSHFWSPLKSDTLPSDVRGVMGERTTARAVALALSAITSGVVTALLLGVSGMPGHLAGSPVHGVAQGTLRIPAQRHAPHNL